MRKMLCWHANGANMALQRTELRTEGGGNHTKRFPPF